jgi:hypothetical protein
MFILKPKFRKETKNPDHGISSSWMESFVHFKIFFFRLKTGILRRRIEVL